MQDKMKFEQRVDVVVEKNVKSDCKIGGTFLVQIIGKDGVVKHQEKFRNGVTTEGKNKVLDVMFHAATQITTWYIGLMDNSGYTAEAAGDTLASHSGWNEFTTYTGNRKEWTEGVASAGSITNGTSVDFAITGSGTLKGVFLASVATGTSGTLWATGAFGSTQPVVNGDTVKITYTVNAG